uniref:orotate phosphoribosyltransferase n=1 Tax=Theileria annulata TaxID=5874 RepID=A0A3B0MF05_THEAN
MDSESLLLKVPENKNRFIELCHKLGAYKYGDFVLRSGLKSNVFFNSGVLTDCESFDLMTDLMIAKLVESKVEFDAFHGCPYKAIPLVSTLCLKYYKLTGKKVYFSYHRKEVKDHGEGKLFVGSPKVFEENSRLVVVDDILTMGTSVSESLSLLKSTPAKVVCVLILLNREPNYGEFAKKLDDMGVKFLEVMKLDELLEPQMYYTK